MSTLILDIETVGHKWEDIDEITRESLTKQISGVDSKKEKESKLLDVKNRLALFPFTGSIVSLAIYDLERSLGAVYYVSDTLGETFSDETFTYKERTESEILEDFWEGALEYDTFVSFNGRSFDMPFILHRSVVNEVRPTVDIAQGRYLSKQTIPYHVDLLDELTFYGAMQKRPSLHQVCVTYGIESPKAGGVSGEDVAELFLQKKFRDIATYNARDVIAITTLYKKWKTYLAPASFINSTEML
ncbi:ribonuclease H-like domain-containing protein [Candidatus Nomurabacteria bacterium]|nr:ribonuclease H-like domain-containing protein [Candidatus Kaiserbacteria bacterium]MCB9813804.1 ribonuclease H-like domain-containing protein [Candidatus Nomurabacteria bacterium]